MKLISRIVFSFLCLTLIGSAQTRTGDSTSRYTRQLPAIDKVELQKVSGIERIDKVNATKILTGKEAQAVATLWREQEYGGTGAACHEPAYAIKFYAKDKAILYVSVCYGCQNIEFLEPTQKNHLGFGARSKKGQALLQAFQKAFPKTKTELKK